MLEKQIVVIDYTNWRGVRSIRCIQPITLIFGQNKWHTPDQWLLSAIDLEDDNVFKTFAMQNIHSWKPVLENCISLDELKRELGFR